MKDYTLNKEDKHLFILNYTEKGDIMTVHFADKGQHTAPNTEENRKKTEQQMNLQIENGETFYQKRHQLVNRIQKLVNFCFASASLLAVVTLIARSPFWGATMMIAGLVSGGAELVANHYRKQVNDYRKHILFKLNEEKLNDETTLENPNILKAVKRKTKKVVKEAQLKDSFSLNDIDKMDLKELRKILTMIQREDLLEFDRPKELLLPIAEAEPLEEIQEEETMKEEAIEQPVIEEDETSYVEYLLNDYQAYSDQAEAEEKELEEAQKVFTKTQSNHGIM